MFIEPKLQNMKEILQFLTTNKDFSLATVDKNGLPRVRIIQLMKIKDNVLYFATAKNKELYQQLVDNSNCELAALHNNVSLRITSKALFDVEKEIQEEIFEDNIILEKIYKSLDNPELCFFRLLVSKVEIFDLNQLPPKRDFYSF